MSSVPFSLADGRVTAPCAERGTGPYLSALAVLAFGAALLVGRTGYQLATGLWQTEDHAYSPLILAAAIWLIWRKRALFGTLRSSPSGRALALLGGALMLHLFFVLINNITGAVAMLLVAIVAATATVWGWRPIRNNVFAIATATFCTPLPGSAIAAVTFPLKMLVSRIAARLLSFAGLPVERQGVMIELGNYRLLVADACSGLQSMFSLAAVSVVYIALMEYRSPTRVGALLLAILPISIIANVLRVLALALITYCFGDEAGQGFLHGFAGMFMFFVAFGALMLLDTVLNRFKVAP